MTKTTRIELLDHGYAELIEHWGSDRRIIESARMSTDGAFRGWGPRCKNCCDLAAPYSDGPGHECAKCGDTDVRPGDEKLLRYLYTHKHSTPFEFAGLSVEIKAPILTFRQWHRHRTQSYNEMSGRYTPLPDENYVPTLERLLGTRDNKNKQAVKAKNAQALTEQGARAYLEDLQRAYTEQERMYQWALKLGVPKELARAHVGVGRYSRMRASANLRNWLAFMTLRCDAHAQHEIRVYADAIATFIAERFPRTSVLWGEGRS